MTAILLINHWKVIWKSNGKLLFSSFAEILCFCACGNAASLPFCVKWH